jgi:NitT/TauT family transport system substrate-binding protein
LLLGLLMAGGAACGSSGDGTDPTATTGPADATSAQTASTEPVTLRLGVFPNITHAPGLIGLERGTFETELGPNVTLEPTFFNAGPSVIEALFAGEIDVSFIGPNPAINGFAESNGEALRIIAGSTSGGALFVVRPEAGIAAAADLDGKRIGSPQLGNTQDVALRKYLLDNGLAAREQGGDVEVIPTENPNTLQLFQAGDVDGAWVPEPWGTRLIQEAGGEVFVDERDLWPNGDFVTTHIIVATEFLEEHPDVVESFLRAHVETIQWIEANPEEAKATANAAIEGETQAALPDAVIDGAWENLRFTFDPIASSLRESAAAAYELDFLEEEPDLASIYALDILNTILTEEGLDPVSE